MRSGANSDGWREVAGTDIGPSEAAPFRIAFLRKLARRGLRRIKFVFFRRPRGGKAAIAKVLYANWHRCRVHFIRSVLAEVGKSVSRVVLASVAAAFARDDAGAATQKMRPRRRPAPPKGPEAHRA